MGDLSGIALALYLPRVDDVSFETVDELADGTTYNAYLTGGAVLRLILPVRIVFSDFSRATVVS